MDISVRIFLTGSKRVRPTEPAAESDKDERVLAIQEIPPGIRQWFVVILLQQEFGTVWNIFNSIISKVVCQLLHWSGFRTHAGNVVPDQHVRPLSRIRERRRLLTYKIGFRWLISGQCGSRSRRGCKSLSGATHYILSLLYIQDSMW